MPEAVDLHRYRLRWLARDGGVDAVSPPILAPCDADAVQQAMALADGDRAELWRGDRFVVRFDHASPRPIWNRGEA